MSRYSIPDFNLHGQVVVVTGAGSGLGAASAQALAAYGAQVAVLDIDEDAAARTCAKAGNAVRSYGCDISDEESVTQCIAKVRSDLGPVTVLVNNAGVHMGFDGGDQAAGDVSTEVWRKIMSVNLDGTFFITRTILPDMLEQKRGSIINLSSLGGGVLGSLNAAYASTKAGIVGFTRSLVIGYSGTGIRANVICPGFVATPMTKPALKRPEDFARYAASIPVGRGGEPDDIAGLVVFLASDASSYVNGALFTLDGGTSLL